MLNFNIIYVSIFIGAIVLFFVRKFYKDYREEGILYIFFSWMLAIVVDLLYLITHLIMLIFTSI
jgi:hypothetical protein